MGIKKQPTSIVANGSYIFIKDPTATSGLFSDYVRVPGLGNFTLPSETGGVTETATLDGPIGAPQFSGIGSITGSIAARGVHPAHDFLEQRKGDGASFNIRIIKPAELRSEVDDIAASVVIADNTAGPSNIVPAVLTDVAVKNILSGQIIQLVSDNSASDNYNFVPYSETASSANDKMWRLIVEVDNSNKKVRFAPEISSNVVVASGKKGKVHWRNPGMEWLDISVTCTQFAGGDFQSGGNVSAAITLFPASAMPVPTPVVKTESELATEAGFSA